MPERKQYSLRRIIGAGIIGIGVGAGVVKAGEAIISHNPSIKPGGVWINPGDNERVSSPLYFAAQAYPTNPGDPPISYVNFTADIQNTWRSVCRVPSTQAIKETSIYTCNWNVPKEVNSGEHIIVSFDVYDAKGDVNKAPNGEHSLSYQPK